MRGHARARARARTCARAYARACARTRTRARARVVYCACCYIPRSSIHVYYLLPHTTHLRQSHIAISLIRFDSCIRYIYIYIYGFSILDCLHTSVTRHTIFRLLCFARVDSRILPTMHSSNTSHVLLVSVHVDSRIYTTAGVSSP